MNLIQFSVGMALIVGAGFITMNVNWKRELSDVTLVISKLIRSLKGHRA